LLSEQAFYFSPAIFPRQRSRNSKEMQCSPETISLSPTKQFCNSDPEVIRALEQTTQPDNVTLAIKQAK
jgi:hypothetical protein